MSPSSAKIDNHTLTVARSYSSVVETFLLEWRAHEIARPYDNRSRKADALPSAASTRGDKSAFLARAGYTLETADQLLDDLRTQLLPRDAVELHATVFGKFYEISGTLTGPNGVTLSVRSIWMEEKLSGIAKFITLIPEK